MGSKSNLFSPSLKKMSPLRRVPRACPGATGTLNRKKTRTRGRWRDGLRDFYGGVVRLGARCQWVV